jgi:ubiquinone/menaquinone biosynthesis C-methylase UbiE
VALVNKNHAITCSSREWADYLQNEVIAPLAADIGLGERMLEVGPGPGAATDWLRRRVDRLVAVESDEAAAAKLAERFAGTNVEIVHGDATALRFPDGAFDAAGSFTMLHHVPTVAEQDQVLAEAVRVLRPGGVLVGSDSLASDRLREFHEGDVYNPVDPDRLREVLEGLGCAAVEVKTAKVVTFTARKPEL